MTQVPGPTIEASRLGASERCCDLFIERGTVDIPIAEIASAVGISPRTFHRYFPVKAESVSPVFDWTTRRFDDSVLNAGADRSVRDALIGAFLDSLLGASATRTRALFPLVFADGEMWAVFLRKVHDGERALAPVLAPRIGLDPVSVPARAAAAAVASATRIALQSMVTERTDPLETFTATIDAFASDILRLR